MKVLCKAILGAAIPPAERYLGEIDETRYAPLQIGQEYQVYGVQVIVDRMDYLVCSTGELPMWAPKHLFDVVNNILLSGWIVCLPQNDKDYRPLFDIFKINSISGYPALVQNYNHYIGILERDAAELQVFFEEMRRVEWLTEQSEV